MNKLFHQSFDSSSSIVRCLSFLALAQLCVVLFFTVSVAAEEIPAKGLSGHWRAVDIDTGHTRQVDIYEFGGKMKMKVWHAAGDLKHKSSSVINLPFSSAEARGASSGGKSFTATHDAGFKTETYVFSILDKGLLINAISVYTDKSKRDTRAADLFFVRGTFDEALAQGPSDESDKKGWLGLWHNRDKKTQGTAQLHIRDLGEVGMSVWGIMSKGISTHPVVTLRLPLNGDEAGEEGAKGKTKGTADLGWAKITYEMRLRGDQLGLLVETDYKDPDRGDQAFEYEFVRGAWKK